MIWKEIAQNLFSDASNSSDIEEDAIKQISSLKPFDLEPRKAIPKKIFVSEEENNFEEEINLITEDWIGNIDSFIITSEKSRSARGGSLHSAFMSKCPTTSHTC